ncbi:MAG: flavin reductase domain protein FMN-binding protein [Chloroflexi bacterium]|nr:flavin reductase domain protein FMN-binding protein [Chloroflexota bacterium]
MSACWSDISSIFIRDKLGPLRRSAVAYCVRADSVVVETRVPISKDDFRQVMGHFVTGVTVITTAHDGEVRGMTANSVTSVSLEPLSVLVCVNHEAITHRILSAGRVFCVNVLSDDQEALSRACAKPDTPEAGLEGVLYHVGETGAPIIDGAIAYLDCKVTSQFEFGTHTLFIGEPTEGGATTGEPLVFYRGKYTKLREWAPA